MMMVLFVKFLIAVAVNFLAEFPRYESNKQENTITFSGHGEVTAVPDIANVYFNISQDAKTVKEAQTLVAGIEKKSLDFLKTRNLTFRKPDPDKCPSLRLAREALKKGGTYPAVLNAADEEAVKSYLEGKIKFSAIPAIIEKVLEHHKGKTKEPSIGDIMGAESWAREETVKLCR